jgi:hypothetical protein
MNQSATAGMRGFSMSFGQLQETLHLTPSIPIFGTLVFDRRFVVQH